MTSTSSSNAVTAGDDTIIRCVVAGSQQSVESQKVC